MIIIDVKQTMLCCLFFKFIQNLLKNLTINVKMLEKNSLIYLVSGFVISAILGAIWCWAYEKFTSFNYSLAIHKFFKVPNYYFTYTKHVKEVPKTFYYVYKIYTNVVVFKKIGSPLFIIFIQTALRTFKPYNIFKYIFILISLGLASDYFMHLSHSTQRGIFIAFTIGMIVDIYSHHTLTIKLYIQKVKSNMLLYAIIILSRWFWLYHLVSFIVIILLFFNIELFNRYILDYITISWLKKVSFALFGDLYYTWYEANVCKLDTPTGVEWDQFASRKVIIMPTKYNTITVLDPDLDRSNSGLWIYRNKHWLSYMHNAYHNFDMRVYGERSLKSPFTLVNAWPMPSCEKLYVGVTERTGSMEFRQLDPTNKTHTQYKVYLKDVEGNFVLTPFKLQKGLKVYK